MCWIYVSLFYLVLLPSIDRSLGRTFYYYLCFITRVYLSMITVQHLLLWDSLATTMYLSVLAALFAISAPVAIAAEVPVSGLGCVCMVSLRLRL